MDRDSYRNAIDSMTGAWATLRDMGHEHPAAWNVVNARLASLNRGITPADHEDMLLNAIILLIQENQMLRKCALKTLALSGSPPIFLSKTNGQSTAVASSKANKTPA